MLHRLGTKLTG